MKTRCGFTIAELIICVVFLAGVAGWVLNLITILRHMTDPITGMFVLRCISVFVFPIGAVLGYF
jgi:hypothetical protein